MLTATQIAAFIGVGLAGAAYVPQIWHLVRVHCSAGISRFAFCIWLGASLLVTAHAIATRATVFVVLGGVQIAATTVILLYATKYASSYCSGHAGELEAETKPSVIGGELPAAAAPPARGSQSLEVGAAKSAHRGFGTFNDELALHAACKSHSNSTNPYEPIGAE